MTFNETSLSGSYEISLEPFSDERGWFARYFCANEFATLGLTINWVQMNHSFTAHKGTVRGMHFQNPPFQEVKMVRCIAGSVYDVIIDLRKDSRSFLQWIGIELSARKKNMIYIPAGFAHGFQSLEDNCELMYHHSEFYNPGAEGGIRFNDPRIGIEWPLLVTQVSARDESHLLLNEQFKGI